MKVLAPLIAFTLVAAPANTKTAAAAPPTSSTASGQVRSVAAAPMNWDAVLKKLSKRNVFRLVYKEQLAHGKSKVPVVFSAADKKLLAAYHADMAQALVIAGRLRLAALGRGPTVLPADQATLKRIDTKYAPQRQELYRAVMSSANLAPEVKRALNATMEKRGTLSPVKLIDPQGAVPAAP